MRVVCVLKDKGFLSIKEIQWINIGSFDENIDFLNFCSNYTLVY